MKATMNDSRFNRIQDEISAVLNKPFNGYLGEAMVIGSQLVTCQRILSGELIVESTGLKLLTHEEIDAKVDKHGANI